MLESESVFQLGGVVVVALALVEVMKVVILKALNNQKGPAEEDAQEINSLAGGMSWKNSLGSKAQESRHMQENVLRLLRTQAEIINGIETQVSGVQRDIEAIKDEIEELRKGEKL